MHSNIRDDDAALRIDAASRQIVVPAECRVIGAAGDHGSEQLTVLCPRIIEGHDVSNCGVKWVGWRNAKGVAGESRLAVDGMEGENVRLVWTVPAGLCMAPGRVSLSVGFADLDGDGKVLYKWSTAACKDMYVVDSEGFALGDDVGFAYDEENSALLALEVDVAKINAAVVAAMQEVFYG